jgi:hypothetical protein
MACAVGATEHGGMTREDAETTTTTTPAGPHARGRNGLLLDPEAARREATRGWVMLTAIFAGGAVLVALAALVT